MKSSAFFRPAAVFLLAAIIISAVSIAAVMFFDARGVFSAMAPTTLPATSTRAPISRHFTEVPVVTAIPPSPTPTQTLTPTYTFTPSDTPLPTATPTFTKIPPTATRTPIPTQAAKRCVSVVGDSVAHGDGVFEIPATGFFTGQSTPVSKFLELQYRQRGDATMQVLNRSASAVGISSSNHPSYFNTVEYAELLQDGCEYTVIIPWLNDLSSGGDPTAAAAAHIRALGALVGPLVSKSPNGKIIVVNYYSGVPAPFALRTFAAGFTPSVVGLFNQQIAAACGGGPLALKQVQCVDANAIFAGMGTANVIGSMSQQDLNTFLAIPPSGDAANMLSAYFGANPNGAATGDGVHLSNSGKAQLAAYLVPLMP